ncbi:hypothetical protein BHE74_00029104 [Ensete ventricosum]|nr:hypothetical protein BHE74_00029104 [Ensete ventricosum]RZR81372.1 hypothetical protein BHM03_00007584 [Ensete ventricosum]
MPLLLRSFFFSSMLPPYLLFHCFFFSVASSFSSIASSSPSFTLLSCSFFLLPPLFLHYPFLFSLFFLLFETPVAGTWTARYRAVPPKINRRLSISAIGGRFRPSTVD